MRKPNGFFRRIAHRVGRRGSFLMFLCILDLLFGWALYYYQTPALPYPDLLLPISVWAIIWVSVGVVCGIQAFAKLDRIAFSLAVSLKVIWGSIMLYSWLFTTTDQRGWTGVVLWYAFAALTAIVSYWPEHTKVDHEIFYDNSD